MKIIEFHVRIMKLMKFLKSWTIIIKNKNIKIQRANHENHANHYILYKNYENHANYRIPHENHKNHKNHRIPCENHENHETNIRIIYENQ